MAKKASKQGSGDGAPREKKKRGAYKKACGFCPEWKSQWCRLEGQAEEQWMHVSGYNQHMRKWHLRPEEQVEFKWYVNEQHEDYIEHCQRCQGGFWSNQDLERHVQVTAIICYTAGTM